MARNKMLYDLHENNDEISVIKDYFDSNIPVYLHGLVGDGKSDRIKEIDPDATIIYLSTESPERINGKTVYEPAFVAEDGTILPGRMLAIKPSWLVELEAKCAREPDKIHVLFFDELSNAVPSIQSFVFNIILKHEVNGKWKLPSNARIAAAGNELKDSLAAYEIAKPLFSRFAHIYIQTTLDNWLEWGYRHNIHPLVLAFQKYTKGEYLRTKYTAIAPNATPRKWEMVSKVLYSTKSIHALYSLIDKEVVDKFLKFATYPMVPLQAIVDNDLYDGCIDSLAKITKEEEFYLLVANLSMCKLENIKEIYRIISHLDSKYQKLFESIWCGASVERKEIINKLKILYATEKANTGNTKTLKR